ncbi:MAG TPA: TolC family outer membrane protein [Stellaceae bacterium]
MAKLFGRATRRTNPAVSAAVAVRHALLASSILAAGAVLLDADRATAANLTEALAAAYNNNPTLLAERAQLRATDEGVPQALSNWRPTVTVSGSYSFQNNDLSGNTGGFSQDTNIKLHPRTVGVNIAQPLYRGGRTVAQTAQAENLVEAERARTVAVEQQVLSDSVTAYMDTLQAQAVLELSINNEQVLRRQLEATQDRFRVGEVTRTDVAQAESRLASASSDRITAEGTLETSRATYQRVIGEPPGLLTAPAERPVLPTKRDEIIALAASNNPNVVSAQFTEAAAREQVKVVRGQLLPTISVVGSVQRGVDSSTSFRGLTADSETIGAQLSVPLYEGGAIYSQTRQAQETVGQRRSQIDDARRQVVQAATQAYETVVANRAKIESLRIAIRSAEIALEGVQQEATVGSRTVLDILNAEQDLFTQRVNLVRAQHDEIVSEFQLVASVGRLTAIDLRLPVALYDVDKHYQEVRNKWIGFDSSK